MIFLKFHLSKKQVLTIPLIILGYILISPIITLNPISSKYLFVVLFIFSLTWKISNNGVTQKQVLHLIFSFLFLGIISILYVGDFDKFLFLIPFILSLFLVSTLEREELNSFTKLSSVFISVLLVGGIISLLYVILGGTAIGSFSNPDGRLNYIFPFSFTNSYWGGFLRPSGIYDEPGAFSFFICVTVTLRDLLGFSRKKSLNMLFLGLLTFSLAHIIFTTLYFLSFKLSKQQMSKYLIFILIFLLSIKMTNKFDLFYNTFLIRFVITETGTFHGDNRSSNIIEAYSILKENPNLILSGLSTIQSDLKNNETEYGANPIGFLLNFGLFLSIPYFFTVCLFLTSIFRGVKYISIFGTGLLLLQRDYIYVFSYGFIIAIILVLYLKTFSKNDLLLNKKNYFKL